MWGDTLDATAVLRGLVAEDGFALRCALVSVGDIMTREATTLDVGQTLAEALDTFAGRETCHVVVTDGSRLAGMLSSRTAIDALLRERDAIRMPLAAVMTRDPVTIAPDAALSVAIHRLCAHRTDCLPVTGRRGTVYGTLLAIDLLGSLFAVQRWLETRAPRLTAA
jgi:CBS domain-containing protein